VGGQPIDLSFFATNVTNQFTQGIFVALYDVLGYDRRFLGKPRMYGVRAKFRFGS